VVSNTQIPQILEDNNHTHSQKKLAEQKERDMKKGERIREMIS
jgi:hypothetical protein